MVKKEIVPLIKKVCFHPVAILFDKCLNISFFKVATSKEELKKQYPSQVIFFADSVINGFSLHKKSLQSYSKDTNSQEMTLCLFQTLHVY